jgi:hypothetical protein
LLLDALADCTTLFIIMLVSYSNHPNVSPLAAGATISSLILLSVQLLTPADPIGRCLLFFKQLRGHVRYIDASLVGMTIYTVYTHIYYDYRYSFLIISL